MDPETWANNKVLANTNLLRLYGTPNAFERSRLLETVMPGDTTLSLEHVDGLSVGDRIHITATEFDFNHGEIHEIASIDDENLTVELTEEIEFLHYGSDTVLETRIRDVDMRAVVSRVTRDITIQKDEEDWGCRVLTTKFDSYPNNYHIEGSTILSGVEIRGCGKENSETHALDFMRTNEDQVIEDSVVLNSYMKCVKADQVDSFVVTNSLVHGCITMGLEISGKNVVVTDNIVSHVNKHPVIATMHKIAGYDVTGKSSLQLSNNLAAGVWGAGFAYPGYNCANDGAEAAFLDSFSDNVAVGCQIGWIALPVNTDCKGVAHFLAIHNAHGVDQFDDKNDLIAHDLVLIENTIGAHLMITGPNDHLQHYYDVIVMTQVRADCDECYEQKCSNQLALVIPNTVIGGGGQYPFKP